MLTPNTAKVTDDEIVIPLSTEELLVGKEEVVTGGVRVQKTVLERNEVVDEALLRHNVEVTRVPVNQFVDAVPEPRQEGATLIVPVVEEVLVVVKRLRLTEEVHITQRQSEYHEPQTVTLRSEEVRVERWAAGNEKPVDTAS